MVSTKTQNSAFALKRWVCIDCATKRKLNQVGVRFTIATCNDCDRRSIAAPESCYPGAVNGQ